MKLLTTLDTRPEAEMVKELLSENGIESMLKADDCGGAQPALLVAQGIEIYVDDTDYADALLCIQDS